MLFTATLYFISTEIPDDAQINDELYNWTSMGFFSANFAIRMKFSEINMYPLGNSKMPGGKYFHALKIAKIGFQIKYKFYCQQQLNFSKK